jgi:hypothetical protein
LSDSRQPVYQTPGSEVLVFKMPPLYDFITDIITLILMTDPDDNSPTTCSNQQRASLLLPPPGSRISKVSCPYNDPFTMSGIPVGDSRNEQLDHDCLIGSNGAVGGNSIKAVSCPPRFNILNAWSLSSHTNHPPLYLFKHHVLQVFCDRCSFPRIPDPR